jgi:hypothetical protein
MKMRQHDVAKPLYCRAGRGSAAITSANGFCSSFMVNAALRRSRQSMIRKSGFHYEGQPEDLFALADGGNLLSGLLAGR